MRENLFCLNLNAECIEFAGGLGKLQIGYLGLNMNYLENEHFD